MRNFQTFFYKESCNNATKKETKILKLKNRGRTRIKEGKYVEKITIKKAAEIMNTSQQFIRVGLQRGTLPIGIAEKMPNSTKYTYYISPKLLEDFIGKTIL